jgi:hypothetical protein
MLHRHMVLVSRIVLLVLMVMGGSAAADDAIRSSGFGSTGIVMGTWRWLANVRGDAHIAWTFTDSRILTDDLNLQFKGIAALAPSSTGSLTLRVSYGHPGSTQLGGSYAETELLLTPVPNENAVVGVPVTGNLLITAAMMNALNLESRQLAIRIEQANNRGMSIAFRREDLIVTVSSSQEGTTDGGQAEGGQSGGEGTITDGGTQGGGTVTDGGTQGGGTVTDGGTQGGGTVTDGGTQDDGSDDGVAVTIEVTDGGRTLTSNVPFLVTADKRGDGSVDPDHDGILQEIENLAMARLNPLVELDEDENWLGHRTIDKVVNFTTVSPYPSARVPRYLVFVFGTTWARDYGRDPIPIPIPGADLWNTYVAKRHNGDIEKIAEAWEIVTPTRAELRFVYTSAHDGPTRHSAVWNGTGTACNTGKVIVSPDQTICASLQFEDGRLKVAASEDKHAYYPTAGACEEVRLLVNLGTGIGEDCGGGPTLTFPVFNIGEFGKTKEENHLLLDENIGFLFPGEKLSGPSWWPDGYFCGGNTSTFLPDMPCSGAIAGTMNGIPTMLESSLMSAPLGLTAGTAEMYEHANFQGFSVGLTTNTEIADVSHMWGATTNVADMISSLKLGRGISCSFYEHPNYKGKVIGPFRYEDAPNGEWPNLSVLDMNDNISAVRCMPAP